MLPSEGEVPVPLVQYDDEKRNQADISVIAVHPTETDQLLTQWGFKGNVLRRFWAPDGLSSSNGTVLLDVSIHRFGDSSGAAAALLYFEAERAGISGANEVAAPDIGNLCRVIQGVTITEGAPNGAVETTVFVQKGSAVIRVTVVGTSQSLDDAIAVAENVAAK
jgi:hypothetical protein